MRLRLIRNVMRPDRGDVFRSVTQGKRVISSANGFVPAAFVPLQSEHSRTIDLNGGCQPTGRAPCRVLASLSLERVLERRRCDTNGVPGRDSQDGIRKSGLDRLEGRIRTG